jgi:hypothetical protein
MPLFEKLFNEVKDAVPEIAETSMEGPAREASVVMSDYLEGVKNDLRSFSLLLAAGKMTQEQYKSAVQGKLEAGKTHLLEIGGLREVDVDRFIRSVENTLMDGAFKILV